MKLLVEWFSVRITRTEADTISIHIGYGYIAICLAAYFLGRL